MSLPNEILNDLLPNGVIFMDVKYGSKIANLLPYALKRWNEYDINQIVWRSGSKAISKALTCVELFKQNIQTSHPNEKFFQVNRIFYCTTEKDVPETDLIATVREPAVVFVISKVEFSSGVDFQDSTNDADDLGFLNDDLNNTESASVVNEDIDLLTNQYRPSRRFSEPKKKRKRETFDEPHLNVKKKGKKKANNPTTSHSKPSDDRVEINANEVSKIAESQSIMKNALSTMSALNSAYLPNKNHQAERFLKTKKRSLDALENLNKKINE